MDINAALKDGYTQNEIVSELGRRTGMDYQKALKDGYTIDEVLQELNTRDSGKKEKVPSLNIDNTPEWAGKYPNVYGALGAAKEVTRFGAESAALVGGGIAGFAAGGPVGAVAGAGLLYGGVKAAERALEGNGTPTSIGKAALTSMKDVGTGAAMEIGGQAVGRVVGGALERISRPGTSTLPKATIEERIAKAAELGITLSPAEATGSKGLALYESMLDKSPFSTTIVNTWREIRQAKPLIALREKMLSQENVDPKKVEILGERIKEQVDSFLGKYKAMDETQLNVLRDNVLKKMGSADTYESIGKSAQDAIAARSKATYDAAGDLYKKVGELIPEGTVVQTNGLTKTSQGLLDQELKKPVSLQNPQVIKVLRDLSGQTDETMQQINNYPEAVRGQILSKMNAEGVNGRDWNTIQSMRSELNSRIAQADASTRTSHPGAKFQSTPEAGVYKQLRKALDADIQVFADKSGGNVKQTFDLANSFYKEGKLTYNAPAIRRVLSSNPERVTDMIFRPKGGGEVDLVKKAIGDEVFNKTLKPSFTKRLLDTGDLFNPKVLETNIKKYGKELLEKVYTPDELKIIHGLASDGKIVMEDKLVGGQFLKSLASQRPEIIVDSIIGSSERMPSSPTVLRNILLTRSVVDKPTFDGIRAAMSDRLFRMNQLTGFVQPERLSKAVQTYERVLKVIYTPEQVAWLKQVSDTGKLMSNAERMAANPSGTAQNVITWGTWGALLNNPISGAFTGIIAPKAMANIYLSDAGRRYFTMGLKTPIGTKQGVNIATKITEIAGENILRNSKTQNNLNRQEGTK